MSTRFNTYLQSIRKVKDLETFSEPKKDRRCVVDSIRILSSRTHWFIRGSRFDIDSTFCIQFICYHFITVKVRVHFHCTTLAQILLTSRVIPSRDRVRLLSARRNGNGGVRVTVNV